MDSNTKLTNKIKRQIAKFSGIISKYLPKVKRRLIKKLVYGSDSISHSLFYFYLHWEEYKIQIVLEKIFFLSKRFFGISDFYNYAIADGIYNTLYNSKIGINYIREEKKINSFDTQLDIFFPLKLRKLQQRLLSEFP